ncbi:MAG: STAS domain-containing protein [Mycobacterium sp.]|nr:STAS domain-containing protein [Mycobacterium sp.]MBV9352572.1 STAS domain-containing protein [Mycobacterium sp.]
MSRQASQLTVAADTVGSTCLLTISGVLDSTTYLELRNSVIKAALDEPQAVLVDVSSLEVSASSAWSVFTSARWHVSTWPDVPIILVCGHTQGRQAIARNGVARYVPVYPTVDIALRRAADHSRRGRRRIRAELPASPKSLRRARDLVAEVLAEWSQAKLIPVATVIVNVFVENVLEHATSAPMLRLETDGTTVTVAVEDDSSMPAVRHENRFRGGERVSGLAIVVALCRAWGNTPTPSGKTVWAVIGPENHL